MLLTYRIVESKDLGDTIRLVVAEDNLEDPASNAVIVDSTSIPGYKPKRRNYAFISPYPTVLVNGVEMWLKLWQTRQMFEAVSSALAAGYVAWVPMKSSGLPAVRQAPDEVIMVVAWK